MENTERAVLGGYVVAENEVAFILGAVHSRDRSYRVVGNSVSLREDTGLLVGVGSPLFKHLCARCGKRSAVIGRQPDNGHRPLDDTSADIRVIAQQERLFNRSPRHREGVASALEMLMGEYRTADDRKIGVGAQHIVRELLNEIKQLVENAVVDHHGDVVLIEHYTVLVVISIGGILEEPLGAVHLDLYGAEVLARRVGQMACEAHILSTELALGVLGSLLGLGGGDIPGILLGLGAVDSDVEHAVFGIVRPLHVPGDTLSADVVQLFAEIEVPVGSLLRAYRQAALELCVDLVRERREHSHDLRIEKISVNCSVLDQSLFDGVGNDRLQQRLHGRISVVGIVFLPVAELEYLHELIAHYILVVCGYESVSFCIFNELLNTFVDHC